jgi:hypothetical protein
MKIISWVILGQRLNVNCSALNLKYGKQRQWSLRWCVHFEFMALLILYILFFIFHLGGPKPHLNYIAKRHFISFWDWKESLIFGVHMWTTYLWWFFPSAVSTTLSDSFITHLDAVNPFLVRVEEVGRLDHKAFWGHLNTFL